MHPFLCAGRRALAVASFRLPLLLHLLPDPLVALLAADVAGKNGARKLDGVGDAAIGDAAEAGHGAEDGGVDEILVVVEGVAADPEADALKDDEGAGAAAGRRGIAALEVARALEPALDAEDGLADARRRHDRAVERRRQPRYIPLRRARRRVHRRRVRRLDEVLPDDVDHALPRLQQVPQRVLLVSRPRPRGDA